MLRGATSGIRASDKLPTIDMWQWRSVHVLKAAMDELIVVPGHGVIEAQLIQLFYCVLPEQVQGHFFSKKQQPRMAYDLLSREAVAFAAQAMAVTTFWHKDLTKGRKWKGRTISGQMKANDSIILTMEDVEEIPYTRIEWGLEEDISAGKGSTYDVSRPEGGCKEEEEAEAGMASPQVAEDRAARRLAATRTAKREKGVKVLHLTACVPVKEKGARYLAIWWVGRGGRRRWCKVLGYGGGGQYKVLGYGGRLMEVVEEEGAGAWLWWTGDGGGRRMCKVLGDGGGVMEMEEEDCVRLGCGPGVGFEAGKVRSPITAVTFDAAAIFVIADTFVAALTTAATVTLPLP
ncbi:hypothetical protein CBR_g64863 [Chara braunii]|uniref:Uncharacterized protein n=1 Tax=Chara braunii TaxID=69332 RepID=A0A388K968_CHABU|nr:hypothetical protein CBR_g64863 [Chara braunii]|eukprot:GBG66590.1 hypothetical protein CBR_g64863 [Chara braunii]